MSLPQKYNQMFVIHTNTTATAFNDAERHGVTITKVANPDQPHWRVVGVHHLTGPENHGQHHLFVDVLNDAGIRIERATLTVRKGDLPPATVTIDKPPSEAGTNVPMFFNDTVSVEVDFEGLPSEKASGIHTRHGDEDPPGTTRGHHSFYVVFQKSSGVLVPEPDEEETEPETPDGELERLLWDTGEPLVQAVNRDAALYKAAQQQGLGERLTVEYEVTHNDRAYVAQIFEAGLVVAPVGQWDQVRVLESTRDVQAVMPPVPPLFWDHHITGFSGSRWAYWEAYVAGKFPGLSWQQFLETFTNLNPQINQDSGVIRPNKVYKVPRRAQDPAFPATAPAVTPATPPPAEPVPVPEPGTPPPPEFAQVINRQFHINGRPRRFIGANIRGLVHYGQDPHYFQHAPVEHREIQLRKANEMNVRLVRVFLAHKDASPQQIEQRLRDTVDLISAQFPDMYLLPALTNLYEDVPFYVKGDESFYEVQSPGGKKILNHAFFSGGYKDNYLPFVEHIVKAFKDEPRIFAWEICNEVKAENAPQLLVDFVLNAAGKIKGWAPNQMVTTGMISTRHAWMSKDSPLRDELYGSKDIDFITIHPYNGNEHPPEIEDDMDLAGKHNKPLIVEEAGFDRTRYGNRPEKTRADMAHWFGVGASCYMPWGFVATDFDNNDGDANVGLTGPLHSDFRELYELHRKCGEILLNTDVQVDVRPAIEHIDFGVRELVPSLPWPVVVDGFDFPVGKPNAEKYYMAAGLVDTTYHAEYGFWHPGEDWNGVGGGDTDLGDPVFATAHGLVVTAQAFPVWGNIVLLEHVLPTGQKVWSQYAHLDELFVKKGDIVRRGYLIGTIGKGGDHRYVAHLHFELRLRHLPASKWGWKTAEDREKVLSYYAQPTSFINSYRPR